MAPTTTSENDVVLRSITPGDESFVFSTWLRNFRPHAAKALNMPPKAYYDEYHRHIERLLARPDTRCIVASPADEPTFIYGWLCWSNLELPKRPAIKVVHYVYVKGSYRRAGVGRELARQAGLNRDGSVVYTFNPKRAARLGALFAHSEYMPVAEFLDG